MKGPFNRGLRERRSETGDSVTGVLTVTYVNVKFQKFEHERVQKEEEKTSVVARRKEMLKSQTLMPDLGDRFIVIPLQNVLSIEISPPPHKIPLNAIKVIKVLQGK